MKWHLMTEAGDRIPIHHDSVDRLVLSDAMDDENAENAAYCVVFLVDLLTAEDVPVRPSAEEISEMQHRIMDEKDQAARFRAEMVDFDVSAYDYGQWD